MTMDYQKAIQLGLEAARDADRNRREIEGVIHDLDREVGLLFKGVRVYLAGEDEGVRVAIPTLGALARAHGVLQNLGSIAPATPARDQLVVANATVVRRLCEFNLGERGYPVEIRYPGRVLSVSDRESLEAALQDLLATPYAGQLLQRVIALPESPREAG